MFHNLDDVGSFRYQLSSGGAIGAGDVELWLKEAKLELGSKAWAGVEDFNWLKKVIVVVVVQFNRIVFFEDCISGDNGTCSHVLRRRGARIGRFCQKWSGACLTSRAETRPQSKGAPCRYRK
jgi:hypothetical protein